MARDLKVQFGVHGAAWAMLMVLLCLWLASQHFYEKEKAKLAASMEEDQKLIEKLHHYRMVIEGEALSSNATEAYAIVQAASLAEYPPVARRLQTQCDCVEDWKIIGDGCEVFTNDSYCIVSTNYPGVFPRWDRASVGCEIEIAKTPNFWVVIEDYEVKLDWDYVVINNHQYKHEYPPQTFRPNGGSSITWMPSASHITGPEWDVFQIWNPPQRGWRMCRRSNCDQFACPSGYMLKASPEQLMCASGVCTTEDDLATCCERTCEAPEGLDAMYEIHGGCTAGSSYAVSQCPITCASGYELDGNSPPQTCLDNGTFGLPSCVASDSADFPWVIHGQCQQYGPSCASSLGVGGRYSAEETCLIAINQEILPFEVSKYQMVVTYLDTEQNNLDKQNNDRLILGVEMEPTSCGSEGWTCHSSNDSAIPSHAWSTSMQTVRSTSEGSQWGPYSLSNMLWTSDESTMGTGWVVCVQAMCLAMKCPSGHRFNCESESSWCTSYDCSLGADVDICCLPESMEDAEANNYVLGEARNISWCPTTSTTTWIAKPDVVGHLVLSLSSGATKEVIRQLVHEGLMSLGHVREWDVQVGLNMSDDVEPVSHIAFRLEQTDVQLEQLPTADFLTAFNNGTDLVQAITHRVVMSILTPLRGDPDANSRAFGSGCEDLHPCNEQSSWSDCWREEFSGMTCSYINDRDVCGSGMTAGPGWYAHNWSAPLSFSFEQWVTVLAVSDANESATEECCSCGGGRCSDGFFQIFDGVPTFCIPCQPGTTSVAADGLLECTPCQPGTFSALQAAAECEVCPPGRYAEEHGATQCSVCPPGSVSAQEGQEACEPCPPGTAPSLESTECIPCTIGKFAGFNATPECNPCPAGQFSAEVGMSHCDLCDIGWFAGSAGRADCDPCDPGSFADAKGMSACEFCPPGQAQPLGQQDACVECELGYVARSEGLSECLLCPAGHEATSPGAAQCTQCEPGFAKAEGAMNCSACESGTYTSEPGRSECRTCPLIGQRTNRREAATGCEECEPGRYAVAMGVTACMECALGSFGMESMMTACDQCEAGRFANQTGLTECPQCNPGAFTPIMGMSTCNKCDPGQEAPDFGSIECSDCGPGAFADSEGTSLCKACSVGTFSPTFGQTACEMCQPGRYAPVERLNRCQLCEVGSFGEAESLTTCTRCSEVRDGPPEFWTTMTPPSSEDEARPSGIKVWTELRGASSNLSCGCRPGTQPRDGACEECGEGLICLGMGVLEIVDGYAWDGQYSSWNCFYGMEAACPGGVPGACQPGRDLTSIACSLCLEGMTSTKDGSCVDCSGGDSALPLILGIVLVIVLIVAYCKFDSPRQKPPKLALLLLVASLGQSITMVQQLGIISLIDVSWSDPLLSLVEAIGKVVFVDLQDIGTGCLADVDIPQQYFMRVIFVFVCLLLVCIAHGISQVLQHRHDWKTRWPSLWCSLGTIMLACMVSTVTTMTGPMQCRKHPNGRQTVWWYPSIVCWEGGDHQSMVVVGSMACLFPAIVLVACIWAVWRYPLAMMRAESTFLRSWSFLFFRYSPQAYWYGPVMAVRNCLIAAVPIMTSAVLQIVGLQAVLLLSLVLLLYVLPWRVSRANDLDTVGHLGLLSITMLAAFFADEEDLKFVSNLAVVFVLLIPLALLALLTYGTLKMLQSCFKEYQFFLCHHKLGAGCFCRLLKMWLVNSKDVKRKVFIDTDNLKNLDTLFDVVGHHTETLVVVNSQNLLTRPWCLGELTTAHRSNVRIVPVYVAGVAPPSEGMFTDLMTYVPDVASIAQFGVDVEMVQEAIQAFAKMARCEMPQEMSDATLRALSSGLVSGSLPERLPCDDTSPTDQEVVIIANQLDLEAASTAMILRNLLNPLIQYQDTSLSFVLTLVQMVSWKVKKGLLVCTNGVFTEHVLSALVACKDCNASVLPIMSVTNFTFPSEEWMSNEANFTKLPEARQVVTAIFSEIAIDFQPSALSGTEQTLHAKAQEVATRIGGRTISLQDKVSELAQRESKSVPHTSGGGWVRNSASSSLQSMQNAKPHRSSSSQGPPIDVAGSTTILSRDSFSPTLENVSTVRTAFSTLSMEGKTSTRRAQVIEIIDPDCMLASGS